MSWLKELTQRMLENVPEDAFTDWTFGFGDIEHAVKLVEKAIGQNAAETAEAGRAFALKAAADPSHDFIKAPVFAPMSKEFWKAEMTFPRILRNALMIAIYSHTEYVLLSWCEWVTQDADALKKLKKTEKGESYPARYLRYLGEDANIALGDFTAWPEWEALDGYRRTRNCLAHRGGVVESEEDMVKIGALPHVEVDESGLLLSEPMVHLMPGACEAACQVLKSFVERAVAIAERDPRWNGPQRKSNG